MFVILELVLRGKQRIDLALQGTVRRGGRRSLAVRVRWRLSLTGLCDQSTQ
jgi:hypothetical protein